MIEIRNLKRNWGDFTLGEINLCIRKGELFGLCGHNGAGKTLLLETIAGIWFPDSGTILLEGKETTYIAPYKRNIGFVYQESWLFPHLSVKENICYGLKTKRISKEGIKKRLDQLIELLHLENIILRNNPLLLSGGEKQKVAIARALAAHPQIILFDEPTLSLDEESHAHFYEILRRIRMLISPTVIFVSHNYEELKSIGARIGTMEKGKLTHIE